MAVDYAQIGQRLKAHRVGLGVSPEAMAERLGVSRAALYNYERGSVPVKVETLERMAELLGVSLPSLLGVGTEYFQTALGFFERLRQIEEASERIIVYYEPVTFLLTSGAYPSILKTMLDEGIPRRTDDRSAAVGEIDRLLGVLAERRAGLRPDGPAIVGLIGMTQVRRLLQTGFIGTYGLSAREVERRRALARTEVAHVAALMAAEPLGIQIGVVDDTLPNQTFEICRLRNGGSVVAVSPFRLGELPNVRLGVASITSAHEAVDLYSKLVADMWSKAAKGAAGADLLLRTLS